jgi:hypothetical protein
MIGMCPNNDSGDLALRRLAYHCLDLLRKSFMKAESKNKFLTLTLFLTIVFPSIAFTQQAKIMGKCDLAQAPQLVKNLGIDIPQDFETIKCLSQIR